MGEATDQNVTQWIDRLKSGDEEAVRVLWEKYFQRVASYARNRMGDSPRRVADEEDVAVSVFNSLWEKAKKGGFTELTTSNDLWKLLIKITQFKVVDRFRWNTGPTRGGGTVRGDSALKHSSGRDVVSEEEIIGGLQEEIDFLLNLLREDDLRNIALLDLEGHDNEEIAKRLGISKRTVERKQKLIRETWQRESER